MIYVRETFGDDRLTNDGDAARWNICHLPSASLKSRWTETNINLSTRNSVNRCRIAMGIYVFLARETPREWHRSTYLGWTITQENTARRCVSVIYERVFMNFDAPTSVRRNLAGYDVMLATGRNTNNSIIFVAVMKIAVLFVMCVISRSQLLRN